MLLLIDDDPRFLEEAERVLDGMEDVLFARDGDHALFLMDNLGAEFSVVLIDLNLPGQDGFSLIHAMRHRFPALPLIAISGVSQRHVLESAKLLGATDALRKPITTEWKAAIARVQLSHGPAYIQRETRAS